MKKHIVVLFNSSRNGFYKPINQNNQHVLSIKKKIKPTDPGSAKNTRLYHPSPQKKHEFKISEHLWNSNFETPHNTALVEVYPQKRVVGKRQATLPYLDFQAKLATICDFFPQTKMD